MDDKLVAVSNGQLVTDSRTVAERFEKEHGKVLRAIDNLVSQNRLTKNMFLEQTHEYRGREFRYYLMNRDGFSLLVMGFTGQKALEWKLKFLAAFNEMDKILHSVPKVSPNPHYRTRKIHTAVRDMADTATAIVDVFGVKKPMALTAAMQLVGKAYGVDMEPLKRLIPAEENPSTMTPTDISKELGIKTKAGSPNPQAINSKLYELGLQEKHGGSWVATEKGKPYCEVIPYTNSNGHSGYRLMWSHKVLDLLKEDDGK
ncbi:Rha family transcriptional regulator [uncultured Megasphaera sp.]|uniref:Rha family transcriptional regulator n=1 Tax=uncultured Megasphaera sp. TaxID=165188 RepID=UPI00266D7B94|nr:Rha family transcriptional regulator [uncultured Megasphaera sp.]